MLMADCKWYDDGICQLKSKENAIIECETTEQLCYEPSEIHLIHFLCDRQACEHCSYETTGCEHTSDVFHAVNFKEMNGDFWEQTETEKICEYTALKLADIKRRKGLNGKTFD